MNTKHSHYSPEAEEAASLWAARLDGSELQLEDRQALQTWLDENPAHRELLATYCQFSTDLEEKLPVLLARGQIDMPSTTAPHRRRFKLGWLWGFGAGLAAACVAIMLWVQSPDTQIVNVATPVAQRQMLNLMDGSQVELDARTSLRIEIDDENRRVRFAEGQAFFAVAKDTSRPFIVETPAGAIRVRGTKFDVQNLSDDSLTVTVTEGVVQVSPASRDHGVAPFTLTVGEQLSLDGAHLSVRKLTESELEDALAWRNGYVVFDGVSLDDALRRFGRHHGIGITCSPTAAQLSVGGRFALDDLNGFFVALEDALPVRVNRGLNGTVRITARSEAR